MKLRKNLWLTIGLSTSPLLLIPTVSCLNEQVYATSDISNVIKTFNNKRTEIENSLAQNQTLKSLVDQQKIIQIGIAAKVNDLSFTQMTWEGISYFSNIIKNQQSSYKMTSAPTDSEIFKAYSSALNKNYSIWVLTGWNHESFFAKWIKNPINKTKFLANNVKVISVDWDVTKYLKDDAGQDLGQGISLNFRTQEASFLIGYSVAQFLAKKYPGEAQKDKRVVNTSAGADASGSTNFNYGFYEGVRAWNNEQTSNDQKVRSNVYKDHEKVFLNTTYIENNLATKNDFRLSVTGGDIIFKGAKPSVVMPVAGDWSRAAANIIKETGNTDQQWVVGVDSNMAISYGPAYQDYFITSSEKRIGIAVFKALCFLTGISNNVNNVALYPDPERINWVFDLEDKKIKDQSGIIKNMPIIGGIAAGFVGASPSTIKNKSDAELFDQIIKTTEATFFGTNGKLQQDLDQNPDKVAAYHQAVASGNIDQFNQAVFNLNNVLLGEMSVGNQGYFNLVVDEINKWNK